METQGHTVKAGIVNTQSIFKQLPKVYMKKIAKNCSKILRRFVTLKTLVILCNTLKKEGRAFRNIGKNISLYCVISLANFRLLKDMFSAAPGMSLMSETTP